MNKKKSNDKEIWINPLGGFGDTLMTSGVLKLVIDKYPNKKFNLIRRTKYLSILKGHPAIKKIGFPEKGSSIIGTDYWSKEKLGAGNQRAFQILARIFGLKTPVEEKLYFPGDFEEDFILTKIIPWREKNIIIAPFSDSPRKVMPPLKWHNLIDMINKDDRFFLQIGNLNDIHIKNVYSISGLTTTRQLITLLKKCDLIITADNFIMHTAHLINVPAIVLWGPTKPEVYGYKEQVHIRFEVECEEIEECIGPKNPDCYSIPCHLGEEHCMNKIDLLKISNSVNKLLK